MPAGTTREKFQLFDGSWRQAKDPRILVAVALAIGLQLQPTIPLGGSVAAFAFSLGLPLQRTISLVGSEIRLSISDVVVLLLFPLLLKIWLADRSVARPVLKYVLAGAAAGTFVMTYGFVLGIGRLGDIQIWALVKYVGWFALLYYLVAGMLLPAGAWARVIEVFTATFVLTHIALILLYMAMTSLGFAWLAGESPRMGGLVSNANAYGLSLLCGLSMLIAFRETIEARFSRHSWSILASTLVAGVLFTRSLGALCALVPVVVVLLMSRGGVVAALRMLILAVLIFTIPVAGLNISRYLGRGIPEDTIGRGLVEKLYDPDKYAFSLSARIDSNKRALATWQEYPWFGTGLGYFIAKERAVAKWNKKALQVHNTALWLLTEFGIAGLAVFAALVLATFVAFLRNMNRFRERDPPLASLMLAGLMILVAWITMSLAHELLYQRLPWFILGMCFGAGFVWPTLAGEPGSLRSDRHAPGGEVGSQASQNSSKTGSTMRAPSTVR